MSVWSEDDDRLSRLIADDDWQAVELFIRECGPAEFNLIWNSGSLQIEEARPDDACRLWYALRGEDDLLRYRSLELESMKPLLGYIMVIEKVVESNDLTNRLYGSFATSRYAEDRTGQSPTVCNVGMGQFFNAAYRASMHCKEPLFTRHAPPPYSKVKACQRLILPFRRPEFYCPTAR
ncbi:MAG: hypothetical protein ACPGQV_03285 [Alphaproteobacteria bacterium]